MRHFSSFREHLSTPPIVCTEQAGFLVAACQNLRRNVGVEWRARWDLNPGPPAPQAGVIIRQHGKNPMILDLTIVLDDEPAYAEYNDRIIKTLLQSLVNYFPVPLQEGGRVVVVERNHRCTTTSSEWLFLK